MSLSVTFNSQVFINETFTGTYVNPSANTIQLNGLNESFTLTASTTPAAVYQAEFQQALSSGSATIDLTNLPGITGQETVSGSGYKVQLMKLQNPSSNANNITIAPGGTNGYNLLGSSMSIVLAPGQSITINGAGATPTISSTAKTLGITGTGSQVLNVVVVMG